MSQRAGINYMQVFIEIPEQRPKMDLQHYSIELCAKIKTFIYIC